MAEARVAQRCPLPPFQPVRASHAPPGPCRAAQERPRWPWPNGSTPPFNHEFGGAYRQNGLLDQLSHGLGSLEGDDELGSLRHGLNQPDDAVFLERRQQLRLSEAARRQGFGAVHKDRAVDAVAEGWRMPGALGDHVHAELSRAWTEGLECVATPKMWGADGPVFIY
eukprot:scaffold33027_cov124-Isochrysis_galbana.AAC.6